MIFFHNVYLASSTGFLAGIFKYCLKHCLRMPKGKKMFPVLRTFDIGEWAI